MGLLNRTDKGFAHLINLNLILSGSVHLELTVIASTILICINTRNNRCCICIIHIRNQFAIVTISNPIYSMRSLCNTICRILYGISICINRYVRGICRVMILQRQILINLCATYIAEAICLAGCCTGRLYFNISLCSQLMVQKRTGRGCFNATVLALENVLSFVPRSAALGFHIADLYIIMLKSL